MYNDTAYAPFGELYGQAGSTDLSFTGQNQDTVSGDYDFLFREYSIQGRWVSPDPAGLAAVNLVDPQSWNHYAYVRNSPMELVDPLGLDPLGLFGGIPTDPVLFGGGVTFEFGIAPLPDPFTGNVEVTTVLFTGLGPGGDGGGSTGLGLTFGPDLNLGGYVGPKGDIRERDGRGHTSGGTPWYKTCTAKAIGTGLLHVGIDAIGLIPEGGLVSRAVGNFPGYRGIVATQQGTKAIQAGKMATGIASTGGFSDDTSATGLISSGLGAAGIAASFVASATPVVGQAIAVASIGVDIFSAGKEIAECH